MEVHRWGHGQLKPLEMNELFTVNYFVGSGDWFSESVALDRNQPSRHWLPFPEVLPLVMVMPLSDEKLIHYLMLEFQFRLVSVCWGINCRWNIGWWDGHQVKWSEHYDVSCDFCNGSLLLCVRACQCFPFSFLVLYIPAALRAFAGCCLFFNLLQNHICIWGGLSDELHPDEVVLTLTGLELGLAVWARWLALGWGGWVVLLFFA